VVTHLFTGTLADRGPRSWVEGGRRPVSWGQNIPYTIMFKREFCWSRSYTSDRGMSASWVTNGMCSHQSRLSLLGEEE